MIITAPLCFFSSFNRSSAVLFLSVLHLKASSFLFLRFFICSLFFCLSVSGCGEPLNQHTSMRYRNCRIIGLMFLRVKNWISPDFTSHRSCSLPSVYNRILVASNAISCRMLQYYCSVFATTYGTKHRECLKILCVGCLLINVFISVTPSPRESEGKPIQGKIKIVTDISYILYI